MFDGFYHSLIGASHESQGIVCQDWSEHMITDKFAIGVVADGHGSKKHFRSDVGSKLAVKTAIGTISEYYENADDFEKNFLEDPQKIIRKIEKHIISRWNRAIALHCALNPITELEKKPFTDEEFRAIKTEAIYGTTLIAVVIGRKFSFGIQLGDGSLVVINENGKAYMPIEDDESCPANMTASMCNSNAINLFNSFYALEPPIAIYASTDGLFTSFATDADFLDYHSIITAQLGNLEQFEPSLMRNLAKRTHYGTQDDISMTCIYNPPMVKEKTDLLQKQIEENKRRAEIRAAEQASKKVKLKIRNNLLKQDSDRQD